jgi:hypothetical protein
MPTQPYKINGQRIPSVTTIIGRFKESGGLLYWANQQGLEGKTLDDARKEATKPGTMAHAWVEDDANGRKQRLFSDASKEDTERAITAFNSYLQWRDGNKLILRHVEVSLISQKHRFGGTLDAVIVNHNQALCLGDWKNANAIYPDNLYQLAAYKILWEENYPDHPLVGGFHLCRFAKEMGDFSHHFFASVDEEAETFLAMRSLYDRVKITEKRVR